VTQTVAQLVEASKRLSVDEQIELFDALWDLLEPSEAEDFELSSEQHSEIDRRREELRRNPETAVTFEEGQKLMAQIRAGR
jgi:putative addiction module component (TIGR02574 family)